MYESSSWTADTHDVDCRVKGACYAGNQGQQKHRKNEQRMEGCVDALHRGRGGQLQLELATAIQGSEVLMEEVGR